MGILSIADFTKLLSQDTDRQSVLDKKRKKQVTFRHLAQRLTKKQPRRGCFLPVSLLHCYYRTYTTTKGLPNEKTIHSDTLVSLPFGHYGYDLLLGTFSGILFG